MGGSADPVLKRIGKSADGWLVQPALRDRPGGLAPYVEKIHAAASEAGRDPSSIGLESRVSIAGLSIEAQVARALEWEAAGCTHVSLNTMDAGLASPADHIAAIEAFANAWQARGAS
jgi:alkanesulfonate monooxygenase SsuD/methylene tetrahydromethanopterin reductase-like flavin-dependent oxidoreductase (luciferase family)